MEAEADGEEDDEDARTQHSLVLGTPPSPDHISEASELLGAPEQEGRAEADGDEAAASDANPIVYIPFAQQLLPCDTCDVLTSIAMVAAAFPRWDVRTRLANGFGVICPVCADGPCVQCGWPVVDRRYPCVWCWCADPIPSQAGPSSS